MYLVTECMVMSAPSLHGFYNTGDMKVLSTARRAPFSWHNLAMPAMSEHFIVGLVGLSVQTSQVFFLSLALTIFRSERSAYSNSIPE